MNWTNGLGERPYQLFLHSQGVANPEVSGLSRESQSMNSDFTRGRLAHSTHLCRVIMYVYTGYGEVKQEVVFFCQNQLYFVP